MALKSIQLTLVANTAQPALVQGSGGAQFNNTSGAANDPLPVVITNCDAAATVYVGGPGVTTATGTPIAPGSKMAFSLIGSPVSDIPYVVAAATPIVSVMVGRQ